MLYADDSALIVRGQNVNDIENTLSNELSNISKWLECNKLSLHLGKTESILFGSKRKLKKVENLNIVCNDVRIESKSAVKYLGAVLDQDISGQSMGNNVISKVNKYLKFLYRNGKYFDSKCRKLLCQSMVQSHFDYSCNMWYRGLEKKLKVKLQCAQNKMIRYIKCYDSRTHLTYDDFKELRMLDVNRRVDYLTLSLMYNIFHGSAPTYLCNINTVSHEYNTRNTCMTFVLPHVKSYGHKSFFFNGVKLWNALPVFIKKFDDKNKFKYACKKHLMYKMYFDESSDFVY